MLIIIFACGKPKLENVCTLGQDNTYVAFSPGSNSIAILIGVYDKNVHFWEIVTGRYLYTLPIDVFYCASISPLRQGIFLLITTCLIFSP
ncbi:hypothetical protein NEOC65_000117 [Neochlamydia sp. AcF65]|nr:hypothetical protein [Neochlamydia sp. AcF65]MBS4171026.1 hypothetical protein [Neochlamydia sp. AcF95]